MDLDSPRRDAMTLRILLAGESVKLDPGAEAGDEVEADASEEAGAAFDGGGRVFGCGIVGSGAGRGLILPRYARTSPFNTRPLGPVEGILVTSVIWFWSNKWATAGERRFDESVEAVSCGCWDSCCFGAEVVQHQLQEEKSAVRVFCNPEWSCRFLLIDAAPTIITERTFS